jgi:hypothetical protein
MAAPADGGVALARSMGVDLQAGSVPIPDFSVYPDPLARVGF